MIRKLSISLTLIAAFATVPAAVQAQCPAGQFYLDLKTGVSSAMGGVAVTAFGPAPVSAACPAAAGWRMAALKINIPTTCTQANVVVEYEGLPSGWSVNLGDSSTNDGFAGGAGGSTPNNAELWVLGEDLALANGSGNAALIDNPLIHQHMALTDGSLKFAVKNQFVSWGQPYTAVQTPASKNLFAIPDTSVPFGDQRNIYLGLNRVIFGPGARTGCGARRVLVTFQ
jgi:hypothetical protein